MTPRILYLVGTSFTGSTVLGALLGQPPGALCVGELNNWTLRRGSLDQICSCGVIRKDCQFWCKVHDAWLADDHPGWVPYRKIQKRWERFRNVPLMGLERRMHQAEFEHYAAITRNLYQVLQQASGIETMVEISKRVGRAQTLGCIQGLDVSYLHLIRDGRGFLNSTLKHKSKEWHQKAKRSGAWLKLVIRTSLEWVLTNRLAERIIVGNHGPSLRIRYEDFAVAPAKTLDLIASALSLDLSASLACLSSGKPIDFGHMGGGNRVRLSGPVLVQFDESWRQTLPLSAQRIFWALAGSTARRYGYTK